MDWPARYSFSIIRVIRLSSVEQCLSAKVITTAEQTWRGSYALLRAVVEAAVDAVFVKDQDGRYLMTNPAGARFLGKSVAEVLGRCDRELFAPETASAIVKDDRRIMATGRTETYERVGTAAGVTRTYLITKGPYRDRQGRIVGTIGFARDITASKALATERNRLLKHLRLQIERLPLAYLFLDRDTRVLDWNPAAEKMFGYTKEEALGQTCLDLIVPHPTSDHIRDILRRIAAGDMDAHSVNGNRTKNGQPIICEWFNTPLLGEDGTLTGIISLGRDITEARKSDEESRRQREILQTIFDHVPVMIRFTDPAGRLQLVNRHWETVLGWSLAETHGQDMLAHLYPDSEYRARVSERIRRAPPGFAEFKTRVRDGRIIDTSWANVRLSDGTSIGIGRDITERKQAEEAQQNYAARLQMLSRRLLEVQESERHHLALELHDEVGQLLTGLRLILGSDDNLSPSVVRSRFLQACDIVDELLVWVRGVSFDLRPAALDKLGLLAALRALCQRYTKLTEVRVSFTHKGIGRRFAPEVETAAYRIIQEGLTNVARHAAVKEVTVRVWSRAETLSLQIKDRGRGFDPEKEVATPRSSGLAGMHERVALLDGQLTIESRLGEGTRIAAELPLGAANQNPPSSN